jgi:hypothetical protein
MKIELKNIKYSEWGSEETSCFQANIYLNGQKVGYCQNDGKGGETYYNRYPDIDHLRIYEMEEYCKTLPPIIYKSSLIDKDIVIDMNLELYIDNLLGEYLKQKDDKKLQKQMDKSILIGNSSEYQIVSFQLPLKDMWEKHPSIFKKTLTEKLDKYKEKGYKLLNTNIPLQFLN